MRQKVNRFVSSDNIHCKKRIINVHSHTEEIFFYVIAPMENPPDTPRKMKMKKRIKVLSSKLHREKKKKKNNNIDLKNAMERIKHYVSPKTHSFISSQVKMSQKASKHGYRW